MNIIHIADIVAIPFFIYLIYYLVQKQNKNINIYILLAFAIGGLIANIIFTIYFLFFKKPPCNLGI